MKKIIIGLATLLVLTGVDFFAFPEGFAIRFLEKDNVQKTLKEIHDEVVSLGKYPGDDFFKREFFVGEDEDDTNKDIHVAIVIHENDSEERMTIQVTYMERTKGSPVVGIAKSVKSIKCSCKENRIDIRHSGFSDKELGPILKDILRAVHDKKRLLKRANF